MSNAQTVVIRDRVYCGGGFDNDDYLVFCYNRSQDAWNTLQAYMVRYFGLGQVRGKLVTVGGIKKADNKIINEVFEFDEVTQSWKQSIPHMPTARHLPAVLSHRSTLTVAGGVGRRNYTSVVEVFREETSMWYPTEELPFPWARPSSLLINNRWYLLGGAATGEVISNRAVYADIDLLLQKALPRDQASTDRDITNSSAWEDLPDTPHYAPAATSLGTSLMAVGGSTTKKYPSNEQIAIHIYSSCTKAWIHISDLPAPQMECATAILSSTELLVIGGWKQRFQDSVYKGVLQIE